MTTTLEAKDPDADKRYALDVRLFAYEEMRRDWNYSAGKVVRAPWHTGFYYQCTQAGETKRGWPPLPREDGLTVDDGSVEWTARAPGSASLPAIQGVTWIIEPATAVPLSVASHVIDGGIVYPVLSGGEDGMTYELTAQLSWTTGQRDDLTVEIPVASQ